MIMKSIKASGKALSPIMVIGILVAISAMVGAVAATTLFSTQIAHSNVVNSSTGITVTPKDWIPTDSGDVGYPYASEATMTLGTTYSMAVEIRSYGAYDGVIPTFTVYKYGNNALADSDVEINLYYGALSWVNVPFDEIAGDVGKVTTITPTDVVPGQSVTFYVEITYWATGHYDLVVSGVGTDA